MNDDAHNDATRGGLDTFRDIRRISRSVNIDHLVMQGLHALRRRRAVNRKKAKNYAFFRSDVVTDQALRLIPEDQVPELEYYSERYIGTYSSEISISQFMDVFRQDLVQQIESEESYNATNSPRPLY